MITANAGLTLGAGDDLIGSSSSDITFNTNKFTVADTSGNTAIAGTLGVTGVGTFTARSIHSGGITVANDGQIGSVGDADSMAIASSGVVTFSQIPVLPNDSINSQHYVDGSIDTAHIADDQITPAKLANDVINHSDYIADGVIASEHYQDGSIDSEHYAANSVDATALNVSGNGTSGYALVSDADGSFSWAAFSGSDTTYSQEWVDSSDDVILRLNPSAGGNDDLKMVAGSGITLTPDGDDMTIAATAGTPTQVVVADESSDTTCFPIFATAATGDQAPKTGSNLTFNSSRGQLASTSYAGTCENNVEIISMGNVKIICMLPHTWT